jgi:hypothetical protein
MDSMVTDKDAGKVCMVKTSERDIGIRSLLSQFDFDDYAGKSVALKANFNSSDRFPARHVAEDEAGDFGEARVGDDVDDAATGFQVAIFVPVGGDADIQDLHAILHRRHVPLEAEVVPDELADAVANPDEAQSYSHLVFSSI